MKTNKEIELRELFGNITYDMIAEQVAQATRQEVLKQPFLLLQKALAELRTQKFFVKTLGAGRDVVLVSDIDKIEKKWLEEKQKVKK